MQYISCSVSFILLRCLKRITFANVYDIHFIINMIEVVLHGLGFAEQLLNIAVHLQTPVTSPLYFHSINFHNFPSLLQADTEKARSSSSSRSSSRQRRVCISPSHFLFVCLHFLSSFSFNPSVNLSSPMFLFVCFSAVTPHFHINRGWMMMSCQSAVTGCVHNTSLPIF